MSKNASHMERFADRRQRRLIAMDERPMEEERLPNPMKRDDWVLWLELQRELESAEIQDC
jgi:hypothetical protein